MKFFGFITLFISCSSVLAAPRTPTTAGVKNTICFVGATPNFFKVGHTAVRSISKDFAASEVQMRLGLISEMPHCPEIVKDLCDNKKLEYSTWPLGDSDLIRNELAGKEVTKELDGLIKFFDGCTTAFLVPPIDGRVKIGELYAEAVAIAKVPYALTLGVQATGEIWKKNYPATEVPQIVRDADQLYNAMDKVFDNYNSAIKYAVIDAPMFLENLFYQVERLRGQEDKHVFAFPLSINTPFHYVTCRDLGALASRAMVNFEWLSDQVSATKRNDIVVINQRRFIIQFSTGSTTPKELLELFVKHVGGQFTYLQQTNTSFVKELKQYLHKTEVGAQTIAGIYDELEKGHEKHLAPTDLPTFFKMEKPLSVDQWISNNAKCFRRDSVCSAPLPPAEHQAPPPVGEGVVNQFTEGVAKVSTSGSDSSVNSAFAKITLFSVVLYRLF